MIPALVDHLWQSTLFAGAAWLLTLVLRKNRAQVRHWIWFTASVKFLAPLALLVAVGELAPRRVATPVVDAKWVAAAEQIGEPITTLPAVAVRVAVTAKRPGPNYLAVAALAVWACGFAAISMCWLVRWRRVLTLRRSATPMSIPGVAVPVMSAAGVVEPGVFGVFRPVLLLPEGIAERLSAAQLDAILAHELCHVRRRDNLTATIHMIVQATFWFHPLVWWLGMRLVDERERACDEEVLRLGSTPRTYAEGILNVCRLYVESPLACVSGVTGSNLKRRIETILINRIALRLNLARKLVLSFAGIAALATPIVIGILHAPVILAQSRSQISPPSQPSPAPQLIAQPTAPAPTAPKPQPPAQAAAAIDWQTAAGGKMEFEVATVKRGDFVPPSFPLDVGDSFTPTGGRFIANFPLLQLMMFAYKFSPAPDQRDALNSQLPDWAHSPAYRFTIEGKAPVGNPTKDQFRLMMQALLAERFKVAVHFETQQGSVLALRLVKPGKLGPKLIPHEQGPPCDASATPATGGDVWPALCGSYGARPVADRGHMQTGSRNATMAYLARSLATTGVATLPVVDQTGLSGTFDFTIEYSPEPTDALAIINANSPDGFQIDPQGPTFADALRDQLGLKLESTKGPVQSLVIDHVEMPSEN